MKRCVEAVEGDVERLRQDAGIREDCHEVDVSPPAWKSVHMEVFGNACTCSLTKIQPEVEAVGMVDLSQDGFGILGEMNKLLGCRTRESVQGVQVLVGNDQDVAGGVGESIQADKAMLSSMKDIGGFIGFAPRHSVSCCVISRGNKVAEDAVLILVVWPRGESQGYALTLCGFCVAYILVAPWRPKSIHEPEYNGASRLLPVWSVRPLPQNQGKL